MVDLGKDLDVVSPVIARGRCWPKYSGSRRKSRGPRSTGTPAERSHHGQFSLAVARQHNAIGAGGTCSRGAIQSVVSSAATVIPSTSIE